MTLKEKFEDSLEYYELAEVFALKFAYYLSDNYISRTLNSWDDANGIRFTSKQVLETFKQTL